MDNQTRIKEIGEEIRVLRERRWALEDERIRLMTAEVEAQSPFKVGQVICRTRTMPYGYHGPAKTERYRVVGFARIATEAVRLRKNGTDGATVHLSGWEIAECKTEEAANGQA